MSRTHGTRSRTILAAGTLAALCAAAGGTAQAQGLHVEVFNPGAKSIFPVTSTLVTGDTEALLIDAQFQKNDAESVLEMIRASGKDLTTIYVSAGDPDFYFGLDVITAAYPEAKVVAAPAALEHIESTLATKVEYWKPILGENAPASTVMPEPIEGDALTVDGEKLEIVGIDGPDAERSFVWIPSLKTVAGGVALYEGVHVWMADSKSAEARAAWMGTLDAITALEPETIVPGHMVGEGAMDAAAVDFTREYVQAFGEEAAKAADSGELIAAMVARYPDFGNVADLEIGAKVTMGEMDW